MTLPSPTEPEVARAVEAAHRAEWAFVLAATARVTGGDLATAEEATADAFVAALETWGSRGVPDRPGAWLTTTARRRALDLVRRDATLRRKLPALVEPEWSTQQDDEDGPLVVDDRLRLVFTCCHPALAPEARVALTLRMVGGLTTTEIAHAFLVPEPTMAARITRAKKKITAAGIPYAVPGSEALPERLDAVLTVVHLVYTTGHTDPGGSALVRPDLTARALDLARVLVALMPDEPEVLGLLAFLTLTEARRPARADPQGRLVLLADQDRTRWDRELLQQGLAVLHRAGGLPGARERAGRFLLQAGIAAAHAEAPMAADTDWRSVVLLYDRLHAVWPSPVVAVNRAVAVAEAHGPAAGLAALDVVAGDARLAGYHYLPAARAELLRRLGRPDEAAAEYRRALAQVGNAAERAFLTDRLASLSLD